MSKQNCHQRLYLRHKPNAPENIVSEIYACWHSLLQIEEFGNTPGLYLLLGNNRYWKDHPGQTLINFYTVLYLDSVPFIPSGAYVSHALVATWHNTNNESTSEWPDIFPFIQEKNKV